MKRKTPGNNVFTRKIQIQDHYNQNSTCLCFRPFMKPTQTVSQCKAGKRAENKAEKIKSESVKEKKKPKREKAVFSGTKGVFSFAP